MNKKISVNDADVHGLHIYGFMRKLKLNKNELYAYAFLYSYTNGRVGCYYGSINNMALSLNLSRRTTFRILQSLRKRGLVERKDVSGYRGLVAVMPGLEADEVDKCNEKEELEDFDGRYATKDGERIEWCAETVEKRRENLDAFYKNREPKYTPLRYGLDGMVVLTKAQYDSLSALLHRSFLDEYFVRYERMLKANAEKNIAAPHSAYKTIKRWIEEDLGS